MSSEWVSSEWVSSEWVSTWAVQERPRLIIQSKARGKPYMLLLMHLGEPGQ